MKATLCPHCGRHAARCGCDMGEPDMRCTCELARREARAEAFREAAGYLSDEALEARRLQEYSVADELGVQAERFRLLAHECTLPWRMAIVDCVEDDGFVTVHATEWAGQDGGLDG